MADINALLGMGISDEEQLNELANQLRGRKQAADFFAATTVPSIRESANREQESVLQSAKEAGVLRRAMQDRKSREEIAAANRDAAMARALINARARAQSSGAKKSWGGLGSTSEREEFRTIAQNLGAINNLSGSWKDEFAPSVQVPGMGSLENFAGRYLPTPEKWGLEEQAKWWSDWEEMHNLIKRHKYFGSAFTKTEQEAWNKAFFDYNTKPGVISAKLETTRRLSQVFAEQMVISAHEQGVSDDLIDAYYGHVVDVPKVIKLWETDRKAYRAKRAADEKAAYEFVRKMDEEEGGLSDLEKAKRERERRRKESNGG